jgi:hypothetical protein
MTTEGLDWGSSSSTWFARGQDTRGQKIIYFSSFGLGEPGILHKDRLHGRRGNERRRGRARTLRHPDGISALSSHDAGLRALLPTRRWAPSVRFAPLGTLDEPQLHHPGRRVRRARLFKVRETHAARLRPEFRGQSCEAIRPAARADAATDSDDDERVVSEAIPVVHPGWFALCSRASRPSDRTGLRARGPESITLLPFKVDPMTGRKS